VATTAVLAVVHGSHEDTSTALGLRALAAETLDLAIAIDLVVLEDSELGLLPLVLDLLGSRVHLLLALLGSTTEAKDQVEGRLLLDVVVRKGTAVLELLAGEDETLLVRRNALLVWRVLVAKRDHGALPHTLNLRLHIVDSVRRLHLKGDSLARQGLYEDLHGGLERSARRKQRRAGVGVPRQLLSSSVVVQEFGFAGATGWAKYDVGAD